MAAVKIYQPLAGLLAEHLGWQDRALCVGAGPELWFPPKDGDAITPKAICNACPVVEQCRAWAVANHEGHGVWGATSPAERERLWQGRPVTLSDGRGGPRCSRLDENQQAEVLERLRQGAAVKALAREYGVGEGVVDRLKRRYLRRAA